MNFFVLLLLFTFSAFATTFKVQSIDQQLKHADGVLLGHYLESKTIRLESGKLATQMIFKMEREFGLQSELFGMDEVIVHYPGGELDDVRIEVQGVPKFVPGEKVVVFTRSHNNRYWGLNLGMGTYKYINYGNEKLLVNTIFPSHPKMGQISLGEFEKAVRKIKGSQMKEVVNSAHLLEMAQKKLERVPASETEGKNRTIASHQEEVDNNAASSSFRTFWLLALLAFLGTCVRFAHRNVHK